MKIQFNNGYSVSQASRIECRYSEGNLENLDDGAIVRFLDLIRNDEVGFYKIRVFHEILSGKMEIVSLEFKEGESEEKES